MPTRAPGFALVGFNLVDYGACCGRVVGKRRAEPFLETGVAQGDDAQARDGGSFGAPSERAVELFAIVYSGDEDDLSVDLDSSRDELLDDLHAALSVFAHEGPSHVR